jgi:hypothetical protein
MDGNLRTASGDSFMIPPFFAGVPFGLFRIHFGKSLLIESDSGNSLAPQRMSFV